MWTKMTKKCIHNQMCYQRKLLEFENEAESIVTKWQHSVVAPDTFEF